MAIRKWQGWSSVQTRVTALMLAMACLAVFGLVMSRSSENRRIDDSLAADAKEHGGLLDRTLELEGGSLEVLASDYSYWDEMVQFVETRDLTWASVNLDEALNTYRAGAVWVFDAAESLLYVVRDSALEGLDRPVPQGLTVRDAFGDERMRHFFIAGPDGPVEIRGATIHPSDDPERKTPVRGYLLAARSWDRQYLAGLTELTGKTMRIEPARAGAAASAEITRSSGEIKFIRPLPGLPGRPEMILTASLRPGWIAMARRTGRGLFLQQIALALLGVLMLTLVLSWWVTRPLRMLRRSLEFGATEALKPLERSRTEFGELARLVGQFFGQNAELVKEVTERRRAEAELAAQAERTSILFEHAPDAYYLSDFHGTFLDGNRSAEELLGYRREELVGASFLKLNVLSASELPKAAGLLVRNALGQATGPDELVLRRKDGTLVTVEICTHVVTIHGRKVILGSARDISARKQAEDALARKNTELAALDEQKNQFLGMAAHDLRNPLAVILNYSEFMLGGYVGTITPEQTKFIATMKRSSEFMLKLVTDLLDVARIEAGKVNLELEPTDLAELLTQNVALNRVLAGKRDVRLELEVAPDLPKMELDQAKIEQVLNNLVSNAVKFSSPGGVVSVRATHRDDIVSVSVTDRGPGIPADETGKLFTAFGRTSVRSTTGEKDTGLGLLIVKRIIEAHHGTIEVKSEVGKGTTFLVTLPGAKPSKRHEEPAGARGVGAVSSTENSGGDNA